MSRTIEAVSGRMLGAEADGIGLQRLTDAVGTDDAVLVAACPRRCRE
jgi:hypothetical protein